MELKVKSACANVPEEVAAYKRDFETRQKYKPRSDPIPKLNLDSGDAKSRAASLEMPANIKNDWVALTIANAIEYEENAKNEKLNEKQKKKMQMKCLDEQQAEKEERRKREKELAKQRRLEMEANHEAFKKQEAARRDKEAKKHQELCKMYNEQVNERRILRENEKLRMKIEAEKEAARLTKELEYSEKLSMKSKAEEKSRYQDMIAETRRNEALREKQKEEAAIEDKRLAMEYKAKLDREEAARVKVSLDCIDCAKQNDLPGKFELLYAMEITPFTMACSKFKMQPPTCNRILNNLNPIPNPN